MKRKRDKKGRYLPKKKEDNTIKLIALSNVALLVANIYLFYLLGASIVYGF